MKDYILDALEQRDETRRWLLEISTKLGIDPKNIKSDDSVHKAWENLKNTIIDELKKNKEMFSFGVK